MKIRLSQRGSRKHSQSSRRRFLGTSAAALGAAAFGRPLLLSAAEAGSTAANSKLDLAVVGCGGQGRGVMRGLLSGGAVTVLLTLNAGLRPWPLHAGIYGVVVNVLLLVVVSLLTATTLRAQDPDYLEVADTPS